jgi:ankyrin repeat protein
LHIAAANDSVVIGRLLLDAGATPNHLADGGMGPLHIAAANGSSNMAALLLERGADINLVPPATSGYRNSPLHWAVHRGRTEMLHLLIARGAALDELNARGHTPLELARGVWPLINMSPSQPPEARLLHPLRRLSTEDREKMVKLLETAAASRKSVAARPATF